MEIDIDLCCLFVKHYNSHKEKGVVNIPDIEVAKIVMFRTYDKFIKDELIMPIELLPLNEKQDLVNECKEMKDIFYTNTSLTENCKILHLIKFINSNT